MTDRRFRAFPLAAAGMCFCLLLPSGADAQERPQRGQSERGERPTMRSGAGGAQGAQFQQMRNMMRPGSFHNLLQPDFQIRDMTILAQQLELDQSQRPIIEALVIDYREAFMEAAREVEEAAQRAPRLRMGPRGGGMAGGGEGGRGRGFAFGGDGPMEIELSGRARAFLDQDAGEVSIVARSITIESVEDNTDGPSFNVTVTDADGNVVDDLPQEIQDRLDRIGERIQQRRERMQRWREREEARKEAGEIMDPSEIAAIARAFHSHKQQLRERLISDIELMLSPHQLEQWPAVQKSLRRLNLLGFHHLSGEQVDLHHVLRDMQLSRHEMNELEPILKEYARELDAALQERSRFLDEADVQQFEALHGEDWDRMLVLAEREADRRVSVRSVNDAYRTQIAKALPEILQDRFTLEATDRAFPLLAQPTRASRMFNRAFDLDTLEPEQRELIEQMQAEHDRDLYAINAQQRQQLREREPRRQVEMLEMFQRMRSGEATDDFRERMRDDFRSVRERMSFGTEYIEQLRTIIPEEDLPELHERERRREWRGMGAAGGPTR